MAVRRVAAMALLVLEFAACGDDDTEPSATDNPSVTTLTSTPSATATATPTVAVSPTIDTTRPFWYLPFIEEEAQRPLFDGTIASVRIGNGALDYGPMRCAVAEWGSDAGASAGTPLEVDFRTAVQGSTDYQSALIGLCADGSVAIAEADFIVEHGSPVSQFGGNIRIFRHTGDPVASLAIAAIRWTEMDIAGEPAAVAAPILTDIGLGQGAIVTYRGGVLTLIHTTGISLDGLLSFGEEVLQ